MQVLLNLLGNALKFAKQGEIRRRARALDGAADGKLEIARPRERTRAALVGELRTRAARVRAGLAHEYPDLCQGSPESCTTG